jgi:hypothetical protein
MFRQKADVANHEHQERDRFGLCKPGTGPPLHELLQHSLGRSWHDRKVKSKFCLSVCPCRRYTVHLPLKKIKAF